MELCVQWRHVLSGDVFSSTTQQAHVDVGLLHFLEVNNRMCKNKLEIN